ncbi:CYTH domain-containing protein [Streptococcus didelphis]|uniref:CYTH domain-containing protein n=1 Tax=Streptococcus didelphis TaxID=102886 RepID=UPI00037FE370|nr:CYTH domain-containing protein [Streptococcus didelphis]
MSELEIEFKSLLTKDEYQRLLKQMSHIKPISQTNYYIDTPDYALKAAHMSLRIRTLQSKAEMTLKVPEENGNREYNLSLELQEAKDLIASCHIPDSPALDIMKKAGIPLSQLRNFGSLTTIRRESITPIGKMALDYNHYLSTIDYELELEVDNPLKGQEDFHNFLSENKIAFKYAKSKVARFTKALYKDKN